MKYKKDQIVNNFKLIENLNIVRTNGSKDYWKVLCSCGNVITSRIDNIKKKTTCSCITTSSQFKNLTEHNKAISQSFYSYKNKALKRGYTWDITVETYYKLVTDNCYYCNEKPLNNAKAKNQSFILNGIDRINNSIGYKENNCVTCCINCNRSKSDRTLEEFKNWIINLYKNTIINENTSH